MKKKRIAIEFDRNFRGDNILLVTNTNGSELTLTDIHNEMVRTRGGGTYAVIICCNDGEIVNKISQIEVYDECDFLENR